MIRGFRYKLAPTEAQGQLFQQFAGVCRLVYNLALEQRRDFWRPFLRTHGRQLGFYHQGQELTILRSQHDWIRAVPQTCQEQALRDLDQAFVNFFRRRAKHPSPRRKGINDTFRFRGREVSIRKLNARWSAVHLPKVGWVKFRDTRPMTGALRVATITRDALGWHIGFSCEIESVAPASDLPAVGIDRGVANTLALSTGEHLSVPQSLAGLDGRYRTAQRVLSRRLRGSKRRQKQLRRVARLAARRARIRRDWLHKASLGIARRFGCVVLEDLDIQGMTASAKGTLASPGRNVRQKSGLNRSILNQGWHAFEGMLAYKLEERGGTLAKVNPAFTSQTCSACGVVDARSRKNQASFECVACDYRDHADTNAAINILRRNTASMRVEGGREAPDEARTIPNPSAPPGEDVKAQEGRTMTDEQAEARFERERVRARRRVETAEAELDDAKRSLDLLEKNKADWIAYCKALP